MKIITFLALLVWRGGKIYSHQSITDTNVSVPAVDDDKKEKRISSGSKERTREERNKEPRRSEIQHNII